MDPFDLRLCENLPATALSSPIIDQVSIDSRTIRSPHSLFIALPGTQTDGHAFLSHAAAQGAKLAIIDETYSASLPSNLQVIRVPSTLKALQAIAKTYRKQLPTKIAVLIGSFGKTMAKDLLEALVSSSYPCAASPESFNSQIGVPLSLLNIRSSHKIAFIEAAFSKKNEIDILTETIQADYGILTNIGNKHLESLASLETVAAEAMKLILKLPQNSWALLPQDPAVAPFLDQIACKTYFWTENSRTLPHASLQSIRFPDQESYSIQIEEPPAYLTDLLNICVKAAWLLGIPKEEIMHVLKDYNFEPSKTEIWKSPQGYTFINETYCSTVQSIVKSLRLIETFPAKRSFFLFGGIKSKEKKEEYQGAVQALNKSNLNHLCFVSKNDFAEELFQENIRQEIDLHHFPTEERAFNWLKEHLREGDSILVRGKKKIPLDTIIENFNDSICVNQCTINLAAIESNIRTLRNKLGYTAIMAMVKAFAYGTDELFIARFLEKLDIEYLGVSYIDEGVALRRGGIQQKIFAINAAPFECQKILKYDLEVGVSELSFIKTLEEEARKQNKQVKVHLHVDTGMGRLGCRPEQALEVAKEIAASEWIVLEGIMTHFACAENPDEDPFTLEQANSLNNIIEVLKENKITLKWKHAANSSAASRFHFPEFNLARIGLGLYGLYSSEAVKEALELKLALSLESRVVGINHCKKGDTISYGRTYKVEKEGQKIAVIPIGYFDGLHRNYSGKGHVMIKGYLAPMVGKICMDFMMVDVSGVPGVRVGDKVLLFGEDSAGNFLSPEEMAEKGNSIIHELITCLGPRIQRVFIYEEAKKVR